MSLAAGTLIGTYRIVASLGAGGMGEVYRAHDSALGREVAIKVLPQSFSGDAERLARFEREARLLAALNHPHIGAIYGIAESSGRRALVLELIEGETLTERIARGLSQAEALSIASQVADALDLAHEKSIVHRDLKPDNIKITPDGSVKVLDFGIAKMSAGDDEHAPAGTTLAGTREGVMIGTAAFMSPEQARGKPVDKRADIWAFGCLLYEMLAGRRAFGGGTASDAIAAILDREPDWSALPAATPLSIVRLIKRCLEKDQKRRLRDIGDARAEIEEVISGAPSTAAVSRPSRAAVAIAPRVLSAALAAALAGLFWRDQRVRPSSDASPPRLAHTLRLTNTPEREFGPAISPDGKWVAYYSDARGATDIWVKYLDSGATLNLTASLDIRLPVRTNIGGLSISPDGKNLAFFGSTDPTQSTYDTWVMPAPLGGPPRKLLQGMQGAQWSPDGTKLACVLPGSSFGDALIVADADGSNPRLIVPAEGGRHLHWPAWSYDGRTIYFIYSFQPWNIEPSEIYSVPAGGGVPQPVVRSVRRAVFPVPMPDGGLLFSANPDSVDLGLWWQPPGGKPQPLTSGLGEYAEARLSADGRRLVSMALEARQSLALVLLSDPAPEIRALTNGHGGDLDPSSDPTGDRIVFSSTRSGNRNLWIVRADGTGERPLTSDTASDHHPVFSPDGRQIAFISDRGGQRGIWLLNAEGGAPRLLTPALVLDTIAWSRDGTKIIYSTPGRDQPNVLVTVSVADGKTVPFPTRGPAIVPAWSPASDTIAYLEPTMEPQSTPTAVAISRFALRFVDPQGQPLFTNLQLPRLSNGQMAWSPDGRQLAITTVPANTPSTIWIVEPGGRTTFRKVMDLKPTIRPRGLTWTKDGSQLILATQEAASDLLLHEIERQ